MGREAEPMGQAKKVIWKPKVEHTGQTVQILFKTIDMGTGFWSPTGGVLMKKMQEGQMCIGFIKLCR